MQRQFRLLGSLTSLLLIFSHTFLTRKNACLLHRSVKQGHALYSVKFPSLNVRHRQEESKVLAQLLRGTQPLQSIEGDLAMRGTQGVSAGAGAFGNGIPSLGLLICEMGLKFPNHKAQRFTQREAYNGCSMNIYRSNGGTDESLGNDSVTRLDQNQVKSRCSTKQL